MGNEERREAEIVRYWQYLREVAAKIGSGPETAAQAVTIIDCARQDILAMLAGLPDMDDMAVKSVVARVAVILAAEVPDGNIKPEWKLAAELKRVLSLPGNAAYRYEAKEVAFKLLHLLRAALQMAVSQSIVPYEVCNKSNQVLREALSALAEAGIEVSIPPLPLPAAERWRERATSLPRAEISFDRAADDQSQAIDVGTEAAIDWPTEYLHQASDLQSGLVEMCHQAGLHMTEEALESISCYAGADFLEPGVQDGRLVEFLFGRAVRHQAERLYRQEGDLQVLTADDWSAAWEKRDN